MTQKRVLIVNSTDARTSSGQLLDQLGIAINASGQATAQVLHLGVRRGWHRRLRAILLPSLVRLRAIWSADVVVVHTSVLFFAVEILGARLLGKRVKSIFWDSYPASFTVLKPPSVRARLLCLYRFCESSLLRSCHQVLLPSPDYDCNVKSMGVTNTAYLPLWPIVAPTIPDRDQPRQSDGALHIVFTGAANPIRGLQNAIDILGQNTQTPIVLHLFGRQFPQLETDRGPGTITIRHHGFVEPDIIGTQISQMDAGLVSLHPDFDLPAFPSKIVSYISTGLPILYIGPQQLALQHFLESTKIGLVANSETIANLDADLSAIRHTLTLAQAKALKELNLTEDKIACLLQ